MENQKVTDATIHIGDISIRLTAATHDDCFEVDPVYAPFVADSSASYTRPDVHLKVSYSSPPQVENWEELFDTQGNWKLKRKGKTLYLPLSSPVFEPELYKMLEICDDLSQGTIYIHAGSGDGHNSRNNPSRRYPLQYPLDEVLMVNLLSRGRGVEMHGLGVVDDGRGFLFTGTSGAGKSTLAGLWKERGGATILSDDRLIIRPFTKKISREEHRTGFDLFGTPWHGDAGVCSYGGVVLDRILVLRQAPAHRLVKLSPLQAAADLLVRCFPTFWDAKGMAFTMEIISDICAHVPVYELQFKPEQDALDLALSQVHA